MTEVEKEPTGSVDLDAGGGGDGGDADDHHHHQMWLSVFKKQIKEKMKRYMERQKDDQGPVKANYWGDTSSKREGNDDVAHNNNNKHKSEYITRLTSLRDSLINQEEANLAQALDRLRLHSLTNRSQSNKLRMRPIDDFLSAPPLIHQRKNMVTTVERFRQIRPSRHQPVIFPLQGRQMLDMTSPRPASEVPISNSGNSTNRSTRSQSEYMAPKPSHTKLDETVQANLQRLIQRTSSIPNIGRKALLKNQDDLEPKAKPLLNIRASLQKTHNGNHMASPFLLNTHEENNNNNNNNINNDTESSPNNGNHHNHNHNARFSGDVLSSGGGTENLNLSPQAHKLSPVHNGDSLDMEKLSQYYHKLISDIDMDGGGGEEGKENHRHSNNNNRSESGDGNYDNNNNNNGINRFFQYKVKYRHSPFKSSLARGQAVSSSSNYSDVGKKHYNSYNSVVSSSGKTIPLSELPNIAPRTMYAYPTDAISDDVMYSDNNAAANKSHVYLPDVQQTTSYRLPMSAFDNASEISKWYAGKSMFRERSKVEGDESSSLVNNNHNNSSKEGRMKIVVDMPNIIFNAASPENDDSPQDDPENAQGQGQSSNHPNHPSSSSSNAMSLKKTVKQHELRQRELQNLLEDVKELNTWSEIAKKRSISEGT